MYKMEGATLFTEIKQYSLFYTMVFTFVGWLIFILARGKFNKDENFAYFLMDHATNETYMNELMEKLQIFDPVPQYFHIDYAFIEILYTMREYSQYSKVIFKDLVHDCDRFLKLLSYAQEHPSKKIFDNMKDVSTEIRNHLHSFIFNVPHPVNIHKKILGAMDVMDHLLNQHLETVRQLVNRKYESTGGYCSNTYIWNDPIQAYNPQRALHYHRELFS